jgi:hypothetical protein
MDDKSDSKMTAYVLPGKLDTKNHEGQTHWLVVTHGDPATAEFSRVELPMTDKVAEHNTTCLDYPKQTHGREDAMWLGSIAKTLIAWMDYGGGMIVTEQDCLSLVKRSEIESTMAWLMQYKSNESAILEKRFINGVDSTSTVIRL